MFHQQKSSIVQQLRLCTLNRIDFRVLNDGKRFGYRGSWKEHYLYSLDLQDYFLLVAQPAETTCGANLYSSTNYI